MNSIPTMHGGGNSSRRVVRGDNPSGTTEFIIKTKTPARPAGLKSLSNTKSISSGKKLKSTMDEAAASRNESPLGLL